MQILNLFEPNISIYDYLNYIITSDNNSILAISDKKLYKYSCKNNRTIKY